MKYLFFLGCMVCAMIFFGCSPKQDSSKKSPKVKALDDTIKERISLNGIPYEDANDMIKKFQDPSSVWSYNALTTYWISKTQIDIIDTLLHKENADGIRIYLARNAAKGVNTFVIVSTREDGVSTNNNIHIDYFNHPEGVLTKGTDEDKNDQDGTTLNSLSCSDDGCEINQAFHINCADAIAWVKNTSSDRIKSKAEWFDRCVVDYLNDELHKYSKSDGVRLYLSRSKKDDQPHKVIITTTESYNTNYHKDYYKCYAESKCAVPLTENGELCPTHCQGVTVPQN